MLEPYAALLLDPTVHRPAVLLQLHDAVFAASVNLAPLLAPKAFINKR